MEEIGTLRFLRRYPVKSMAGEDLEEVFASYAGIVGDRVYAFVDNNNHTRFPWMTARQAHEMLLFKPRFVQPPEAAAERPEPGRYEIQVRTPEDELFQVTAPEFCRHLENRFSRSLSLRFSERGMQDSRPVSLLGLETVRALSRESGMDLDHRRFRANFYAEWSISRPFYEDELVGRELRIGETFSMMVVKKDPRCVIITLDPESAAAAPVVLETVARNHAGCAGVYGAVLTEGIVKVKVGDAIRLL